MEDDIKATVKTSPRYRVHLTLEALIPFEGEAPPNIRIRKLLKSLIRHHGFRCVEITDQPPIAEEVVPSDHPR